MYTFFAGSESWIGDLYRLRPVYSVHRSQGKKDRGDEHVIDSITSPLFRKRISRFAQRRDLVHHDWMATFFAGSKSWIGDLGQRLPVSCPSQPLRERRGDQHVIDSITPPHVAALTHLRHLDVFHRSRTPRASATRRELSLIWPRRRAASVLLERAVVPTELRELELVLRTPEGSWWVLWLCAILAQCAE